MAEASLLRERLEGEQRVTPMELFFDLVYVFAVTQIAHLLLGHLDPLGAAQSVLVLLAVWRAWIDTAWITNWFDPDKTPVRLLLLAITGLSLVMSAAIPHAFTNRGLVFAAAYAAIQVGKPAFAVAALGAQPQLRRNFQRILAWCAGSALLWLAGGAIGGTAQDALWLAAVIVDYMAPAAGFFTPGWGRSTTRDWTIVGTHLAERCQLFLLIALGESILDTGVTFSDLSWSAAQVGALVVAFTGTVALWWIYFFRSAEGGSQLIASAADPGRLGRSAYTYFHLPMVAGIIVTAVADAITVADPAGAMQAGTAACILGGPALFLAGHALFKWSLSGRVYLSRVVGIVTLAILTPLALVATPLLLAFMATLVPVGVASWDTWTVWQASTIERSSEEPGGAMEPDVIAADASQSGGGARRY
jgi:low temperature requirement protein LtrA